MLKNFTPPNFRYDPNLVLHEYIAESDIIAVAYMHYPKDSEEETPIHSLWPRLRGLGW